MHELAAQLLKEGGSATQHVGRTYSVDGFEVVIDLELALAVNKYVDEVRALHAVMGGEMVVEQTYPIDHITGEPNAVSTTDVGIIPPPGKTEAFIGDLKGGMGVPVVAEGNEQLQGYSITMYDAVSLVADIKSVRMMIFQPRLNRVTEWVQTVAQLEEFRTRAMAAAKAHGSGDATPGEKQCRWCSKKATCGALAKNMFNDLEELPLQTLKDGEASTDELSYAMGKVETMESWCKAVRAETEKRLLDGRKVSGWKLVQGKRGNRQWSNAKQAEALMKSMRLKEAQMYDFSLVSPTTADKLAKAGVIGPKQWGKVEALITQKAGSPSVAPESDKREALDLTATFTNLDQEVTAS